MRNYIRLRLLFFAENRSLVLYIGSIMLPLSENNLQMKLLVTAICGVILFFSSCHKEEIDYGYGDFRIDLATVSRTTTSRVFKLDNQLLLFPEDSIPDRLSDQTRVVITYNNTQFTDSFRRKIKVLSVSEVNTSAIKPLVAGLADDALYLESAWQTGDWLNFRVSYQYFSTKHSMALYQNNSVVNDTIYLELRHSTNGDKPGYTVRTLLSYSLKPYARQGIVVPVKLRVNSTNNGVYHAVFNYLSPIPN